MELQSFRSTEKLNQDFDHLALVHEVHKDCLNVCTELGLHLQDGFQDDEHRGEDLVILGKGAFQESHTNICVFSEELLVDFSFLPQAFEVDVQSIFEKFNEHLRVFEDWLAELEFPLVFFLSVFTCGFF